MKLQSGDLAVLDRPPERPALAGVDGRYLNVISALGPPAWVPGSSSLSENEYVTWDTVITVLDEVRDLHRVPGWAADGSRWIEALWPDGRVVLLREKYWKKA